VPSVERGAKDDGAVSAAALVAGLLVAQQVAGRALRDALFLSAYSVASLPGMMLASALVSVCGALAFAAALVRHSPVVVTRAVLALQALLLVAEWMLLASSPRLVAVVLYVQIALLGPGLLSSFWSAVNERFDPHTARRVVGTIGTGASLGGVAGGALAWAATRLLGAAALLPALAIACVTALAVLPSLRATVVPDEPSPSSGDGLLGGLRSLGRFPYLTQLAAIVALGALSEALFDYLLKAGAAGTFAERETLARFFGLFYAGVALLTLAVQMTATGRALQTLGLSGTAAVQPAAVCLASVGGLAWPGLAAAATARGLGNALRDSLFRSAYELFYAPLPPWQKRRCKTLVDIAADKLGAIGGASIVIFVAAHSGAGGRVLWLLALVATACSALLARRLHRGYVAALEYSLRSGLVALEPDEILDSTTRLTLTRTALDRNALLAEISALHGAPAPVPEAAPGDSFLRLAGDLRSGAAERIRAALGSVGDIDASWVALLVPLLTRDDVLPEVLRVLRRAAPAATGQLVDALLDHRQPARVRRRIPRVLKASPTPRAIDGLLAGLAAPEFSVRRACALVLGWMRSRDPQLAMPATLVYAAVERELAAEAAEGDAQLDHVFVLLSLVGQREPLRVSRWALREGGEPRIRGTALEYLEQILPEGVRRKLLQRLGADAVARPLRARNEIEDELQRSSVLLRSELRAGARRPPRETP
jgi:hypothetical protein